jgi:hypothetical protein
MMLLNCFCEQAGFSSMALITAMRDIFPPSSVIEQKKTSSPWEEARQSGRTPLSSPDMYVSFLIRLW